MRGRIILVVVLASAASAGGAEKGWIALFNGKSLGGWAQKNGTAAYRVADGAIVGKTAEGSPNSFLCTEKEYADFELEFEVKVDSRLNSGVQVRSREKVSGDIGVDAKAFLGRVHGPQVEIAAGDAAGSMSGFVYGEATGRGWIVPPERLAPHRNFKDGEWNQFRILAEGPRIRTWINGAAVDDLSDEALYRTHARGFIGLQVHGVKPGLGPFEVAWRKIRIREIK